MTNPQDGGKSPANAATAVIAAVLAILGGLVSTLLIEEAVRWIGFTRDYPNLSDQARSWFNAAAPALTVVLLLSGATLLLMRRLVGRLLIVIGCGANIAMLVVQALFPASDAIADIAAAWPVLAVFPLATIVLAMVPSTRRWCKSSH
jgi:hypothetical protein